MGGAGHERDVLLMAMAKNLALLALILGVASLFLPMTQALGGAVTVGAFSGTETNLVGALLLMGPTTFAALFGATLGRSRFGRGLGVLHFIFGALSLLLCSIILTDDNVASGMVQVGMGTWLATAAGALAVVAGLIGLIKPDPKLSTPVEIHRSSPTRYGDGRFSGVAGQR